MGLVMKQHLEMMGVKKTGKTKCVIKATAEKTAGKSKCSTKKSRK